jgi:hypothetical protein
MQRPGYRVHFVRTGTTIYAVLVGLALLQAPDAPAPDAGLLRALIGMDQLGIGVGDETTVKDDMRAAITTLSSQRAMYGETVAAEEPSPLREFDRWWRRGSTAWPAPPVTC